MLGRISQPNDRWRGFSKYAEFGFLVGFTLPQRFVQRVVRVVRLWLRLLRLPQLQLFRSARARRTVILSFCVGGEVKRDQGPIRLYMRHLDHPKRYEFAARAIDEIGRLVGGRLKAQRAVPA